MPIEDHEKNRKAWNFMTDLHVNHPSYKTQIVIDGGSSLHHLEEKALGDVKGKTLLHLMCHFGLDTLSWARKGAIVTGADISDRAIEVANEVKAKAGLEAEFIRTDILELPKLLNKKFDIIFQSYGTFCWLSDLNKWAQLVAHFLNPGGMFYVIDTHPIVYTFTENDDYFKSEPLRCFDNKDYCETDTVIDTEMVEFQHTVSDTLNALIAAGLVIQKIEEYNYCFDQCDESWEARDDGYFHPVKDPNKYPLMLAITASKK